MSSVLNVKTSHKGFPKASLLRLLTGETNQPRLSVCIPREAHMRRTRTKIKATAHRGLVGIPLCLVSSYFTTQPARTMKYMVKHHTDTAHLVSKEI